MRQQTRASKEPAEKVVQDIRRARGPSPGALRGNKNALTTGAIRRRPLRTGDLGADPLCGALYGPAAPCPPSLQNPSGMAPPQSWRTFLATMRASFLPGQL